jgi:uncharacterized protein YndB with AHSA1/START domain
MDAPKAGKATESRTTAERISPRELVVTRLVDGPARLVFEAFTRPELLRQWWVPKSSGLELLSCEVDARVGGTYRLVFRHGEGTMAFYGTYRDVTPPSRQQWTNEESGDAGSVTTVTFEERGGKTLVVLHDLYPTKEALDALAGMEGAMAESLEQLDEFVAGMRRPG